jgi:CheY-like chemotaxis protein
MITRHSPKGDSVPEPITDESASLVDDQPDVADHVVWLNCRGKTCADLVPELRTRLSKKPPFKPTTLLVIQEVDRLEDSVVEFLTEIHSATKRSRRPTLLVDPSGCSAWLMKMMPAAPHLAVYAHEPTRFRPLRILLVDGDEGRMGLIHRILRLLGHDCRIARSAAQARQHLAAKREDVIFLELGLPGSQASGMAELCRRSDPGAALIGVAAAEDAWVREVSHRFGFRRVMTKPYSMLEILKAMVETGAGNAPKPKEEKPTLVSGGHRVSL